MTISNNPIKHQTVSFDDEVISDFYSENLQYLIHTLEQTTSLTPAQAKNLLIKANISPKDLVFWADFEHPDTDSYGRKLVFQGKNFEIMVMSWNSGDFSAIHDHGSTQWGAVQCFGKAEHYIYSFTEGILTTVKSDHYTPGEVYAVDHNLIHQMGNAGDESFLSLHIYGCQEASASITADARIFDLLENSIQYTDGGVFFCLSELQINRRIYGLKADQKTMNRDYRLMSDRIRRILKTQSNESLTAKLIILQSFLFHDYRLI